MTAHLHTQSFSHVYAVTLLYDGKIHHVDMQSVNESTARSLVRMAYPKCTIKKVETKHVANNT